MNDLTYSGNLNASLDAPDLDPQHLVIANEMLTGKSIPQISDLTGLSIDQVTSIAERSEIKRYVDAVYMSQGYINRVRRMQVINKVIDEKLLEAADTGVYSKRDLLEWLKLLNDMDKTTQPKTPTTAVQVNQTNNYSSLMNDLLGGSK
jgi:hypothetical protein